jgi:hypothetical protein
MNDLQKKLDELIALRDTLVHLTNNFEVSNIKTISGTSDYVGKVQVIAKQHQNHCLKTKTNFKNAAKDIQIKYKESQRLAKESQRLINESRRITKESVTNFKNENKTNTEQSINLIKTIIDKIETDINASSIELTKLITLDKIYKLCDSLEYLETFLKTYLPKGCGDTNDNILDIILTNIRAQCDWHYPALQINPVSKNWIDCMVASDPLYLINHVDKVYISDVSVATIIIDYPKEYQRRLRIYDIQAEDYSALPQEQFGIISCCNFLNFFDVNIINNYLTTFIKLLRPGGKLICTVRTTHPCSDTLIEQEYFKYTSTTVLQKLFEYHGYEISSIVDLISPDINWECNFLINAQKPGVLATSKAHQVLGAIVEK